MKNISNKKKIDPLSWKSAHGSWNLNFDALWCNCLCLSHTKYYTHKHLIIFIMRNCVIHDKKSKFFLVKLLSRFLQKRQIHHRFSFFKKISLFVNLTAAFRMFEQNWTSVCRTECCEAWVSMGCCSLTVPVSVLLLLLVKRGTHSVKLISAFSQRLSTTLNREWDWDRSISITLRLFWSRSWLFLPGAHTVWPQTVERSGRVCLCLLSVSSTICGDYRLTWIWGMADYDTVRLKVMRLLQSGFHV